MNTFLQRYYQEYKQKGLSEIQHLKDRLFTRWTSWQNTPLGKREKLALFVTAFLLGLSLKVIALQWFTIGYEDYKITSFPTTLETMERHAPLEEGPSCQE